jgi:hypothetical protein
LQQAVFHTIVEQPLSQKQYGQISQSSSAVFRRAHLGEANNTGSQYQGSNIWSSVLSDVHIPIDDGEDLTNRFDENKWQANDDLMIDSLSNNSDSSPAEDVEEGDFKLRFFLIRNNLKEFTALLPKLKVKSVQELQ